MQGSMGPVELFQGFPSKDTMMLEHRAYWVKFDFPQKSADDGRLMPEAEIDEGDLEKVPN